MRRTGIPESVKRQVLIEAGYRCGVPTCRNLLLLDLHHMVEVAEGGGNEPGNLLPLCPTCHALYTRKKIPRDAIRAWKVILVSLSQAFDRETIDNLLFLRAVAHGQRMGREDFLCTGDGVSRFAPLYAAGLATFQLFQSHRGAGQYVDYYQVRVTPKGVRLIEAWLEGSTRDAAAALDMDSGPGSNQPDRR